MNKIIAASFALIGAVSGIVGIITTKEDNIRHISLYGLALAISAISIFYFMSLLRERSRNSIGVDAEIIEASFRIRDADEDDIRWIASLQKSVYSNSDAVPLSVLLEWFKVFPNGFFIIVNHNNDPIGHIDILPIKDATLRKYKDGEIVETEIRGECLYTPNELDKITDLYVESLIISPVHRKVRPFALRALLRSMPEIIARVGITTTLKRISAMAATKDGERILEHLGFQMISDSAGRKDGHKMYEAKFSTFYNRIIKAYHADTKLAANLNIGQGL